MNVKAIGRGQGSRIGVMVAAGILAVGFGGAAVAATGGSTSVIKSCYATRTGALALLTSSHRTCGSGTKAISWNQVGQRGPAGPPGPAGVSKGFQYVNGGSTTWSFGGPLLVWNKPVPVTGTYYVNGVVNVALSAGDEAWCAINNSAPATTAANNTGAKVDMTIPITAVVTQNAGTNVTLDCSDVKENGSSQVAQFAFTGILVTTSS